MDLGLSGRVALVTGASSGLGLAVAEELAAEGAHIAMCARDPERLARAADRVDAAGTGRVSSVSLDIRNHDMVTAWVHRTASEFGELNVVVTNGAGPPPGRVGQFEVPDYRDALESSLLAHVNLANSALPHLLAGAWGRLLMIASETVRQVIPWYGLSNVVRSGLVGFAKSLVHELGSNPVTVNVLAPGYHRTPALERQFDGNVAGHLAEIGADIPLGRVGEPAEFAATAAFLSSARASFVTGTVQLVDGGANRGMC